MAACGGHFVGIGLYIFPIYFWYISYLFSMSISWVFFQKYPFESTLLELLDETRTKSQLPISSPTTTIVQYLNRRAAASEFDIVYESFQIMRVVSGVLDGILANHAGQVAMLNAIEENERLQQQVEELTQQSRSSSSSESGSKKKRKR